MLYPPMSELLKHIPSRYLLVNVVARRARQIAIEAESSGVALEDKPGQLTRVSEIISGMGANVVSVQYDLADPNMPVTSCFLKLGLETRDHTQIEQIKAKLTE